MPSTLSSTYTLLDRKDCTNRDLWSKTTLITDIGSEGGAGENPPLEKRIHFLLGPWLLVCQFIEISNQMKLNGEVSNIEQKNLYNTI